MLQATMNELQNNYQWKLQHGYWSLHSIAYAIEVEE